MQTRSLLCLFCFLKTSYTAKHFPSSSKFQWKWPQSSNRSENTQEKIWTHIVSLGIQTKTCYFYTRLRLSQSKDLSEKQFCLKWFFFLEIVEDVKSHPSNLVSYHLGGLPLRPAIYSSLINLIVERRISFNIFYSGKLLCITDSFAQKGFVLLSPEPQPAPEMSPCPASAKVCPSSGWSIHGALPLAQSKASSLCDPQVLG